MPGDTDTNTKPVTLNRDQIFDLGKGNADLGEPVLVELPEWNGSLYVRQLSGEGRDAWNQAQFAKPSLSSATVVAYSVCNEKGDLLFSPNDVEWLAKRNGQALQRIVNQALSMSAVGSAALEQAEKNLETDPSDDFGSKSLNGSEEPPLENSSGA